MEIRIKKSTLNRVFILEDDQFRIDWFTKVFAGVPNVFITKRAAVAIMELTATLYDLILLDHDLDERSIYEEDLDVVNQNTGHEVAKALRNTVNRETPVVVHSMNPTGAGNMIAAHPFNITHVPFRILMHSLVVEG
jgi:CheY-like chemotaxis protein